MTRTLGLSLALLTSLHAAEPITNSIGMKLVRIEPGSFTMGQDGPAADYKMTKHPAKFDDADWDEKPAHRVTITQPFHVAVTEVTLAQYRHYEAGFRPKEPGGECGELGAGDEVLRVVVEERGENLPAADGG